MKRLWPRRPDMPRSNLEVVAGSQTRHRVAPSARHEKDGCPTMIAQRKRLAPFPAEPSVHALAVDGPHPQLSCFRAGPFLDRGWFGMGSLAPASSTGGLSSAAGRLQEHVHRSRTGATVAGPALRLFSQVTSSGMDAERLRENAYPNPVGSPQ